MRIVAIGLLGIPVVCGVVATAAFNSQGGFGAGHGDADPLIGLLGCPALFLLPWLPVPDFISQHDLIAIIWLPAVLNELLVWGPIAWFMFRLSRRAPDARPLSKAQGPALGD
ncbi:MAG: hypothetical protein AAB074_14945 [Planctomycetota bacterium]